MRILFVSLEFSAAPFSGNGIYAMSQVRALVALGHEVLVLAGKPPGHDQPPRPLGATLHEVGLPSWGRVDRARAFLEFAAGCGALAPAVRAFQPLVALGVDWSARMAVQAALANCQVPYVFLNYRVFLRSCLPQDEAFYEAEEAAAALAADLTVVLCPSDAAFVSQHFLGGRRKPVTQALLPCLREDMARLPQLAAGGRRFLTCCVRLSPEKEPERFVQLVAALQQGGHLDRLQVTPLLCASTGTAYAAAVRQQFRAAAPSAIAEERFLGPQELARVFAATRLNLHPPRSEAFGMTVVEAASQGAPSLVNAGDAVGATALLQPGSEVLQLDFGLPVPELAAQLAALLGDAGRLDAVGQRAAAKARSWSEAANARQLAGLLAGVLGSDSAAWS